MSVHAAARIDRQTASSCNGRNFRSHFNIAPTQLALVILASSVVMNFMKLFYAYDGDSNPWHRLEVQRRCPGPVFLVA